MRASSPRHMSIIQELFWFLVAGLGAAAVGMIASSRGEQLNAVWLAAGAACIFVLGSLMARRLRGGFQGRFAIRTTSVRRLVARSQGGCLRHQPPGPAAEQDVVPAVIKAKFGFNPDLHAAFSY